jgi:fermentation-respiration switch protein FrsA (DUF1100 family)
LVKAYRAPEDNSIQPYRLEVPEDYDPTRPYPLVVYLHGHGGGELTVDTWYSSGRRGPNVQTALMVHPYARGSNGYRLLGRNDVFHVIEEVCNAYKVDRTRICLAGSSMGAGGTWYLASRYPDLWSACSPQSGGAGLWAWKEYHGKQLDRNDWRELLGVANTNLFVIENLLNVPAICFHGLSDRVVPPDDTEFTFSRLRELKYEAVLLASVRGGHDMPSTLDYSVIDWMLSFQRPPVPRKVRYRTCDLRYNKAYWVEIDELAQDYRLSEVQAEILKPGDIRLATENVARLTLELPSEMLAETSLLTVEIDGTKLTLTDAAAGQKLHLAYDHDAKGWHQDDRQYRPGRIKRHGLCGPLQEALGERFLIVYGTAGDEEADKVNRAEAEKYARDLTGVDYGSFWGNFAPKADTELTETDVQSANLILFGGADSNAFTARIINELPLAAGKDKLTFRGKTYDDPSVAVRFIYPNPANPDKYVVVNCGATPEAIKNIDHDLWAPDWLIFDGRGKARREDKKPVELEGGFFDKDWN